jgi:hypothetical protein
VLRSGQALFSVLYIVKSKEYRATRILAKTALYAIASVLSGLSVSQQSSLRRSGSLESRLLASTCGSTGCSETT